MSRLKILRLGLVGLAAGLVGLAIWSTMEYKDRPLLSNSIENYEGTVLDGPAADFRLVDQHGLRLALSDFRGRVVVLAFLDSQCQEVCPLTAIHLRAAHQALDNQAQAVVFLGVNINVSANTVADVFAATQKWRLDEVPNWHFLTGSPVELEPVWEAYDVAVVPAPAAEGELTHTPGVFLIDPAGQKRWYVSTPFDDAGTPQWTPPLSDLLVKHIQELLSEIRAGDGT